MAARYPAGSAKFGSVVAGHGVLVRGVNAVNADPVAAMLLPRTVEVETLFEVDRYMGAPLCRSEKQQISRAQELIIPWADRHWAAKPFLLVSISRQPDALAGKGGLHEA